MSLNSLKIGSDKVAKTTVSKTSGKFMVILGPQSLNAVQLKGNTRPQSPSTDDSSKHGLYMTGSASYLKDKKLSSRSLRVEL